MKHQQVVVDYWTMLKTSCTCLLLAISGYVLLKMVQTIFYLPGYLKNNQKRLEEFAAKYNLDLDNDMTEPELLTDDFKEYDTDNGKEKEDCKENIETDIASDLNKEPKKVK